MRLSPVSLTEEETELLWLAGVDVPSSASFTLYDYQTDGNLHAIFFSRYLLNDALEWEKDDSLSPGAFDETPLDAAGRLSLTLGEDGAYTFYVRAEGGLRYSHAGAPASGGPARSAAVGASSQTEPLTITYGQGNRLCSSAQYGTMTRWRCLRWARRWRTIPSSLSGSAALPLPKPTPLRFSTRSHRYDKSRPQVRTAFSLPVNDRYFGFVFFIQMVQVMPGAPRAITPDSSNTAIRLGTAISAFRMFATVQARSRESTGPITMTKMNASL